MLVNRTGWLTMAVMAALVPGSRAFTGFSRATLPGSAWIRARSGLKVASQIRHQSILTPLAMNLDGITAKNIDGEEVDLGKTFGTIVMWESREHAHFAVKLAEDYNKKGLVILGFPSNQFGAQEPGTNSQIKTFATSNYGVKPPFYLMSKVDVNGSGAHPLWAKLKKVANKTLMSTLGGNDIKWNFTKFLLSADGVVRRYEPVVMPDGIRGDIDKVLSAQSSQQVK